MSSLLGRIFAQVIKGDDGVIFRPSRKFTTKDIHLIAERGGEEFRSANMNVLSCYGPLEGEFGLYETLSNFLKTKNPMTAEINEAVVDGDEVALIEAFQRVLELAFITLVEKGALRRLQLVDQYPPEAVAEYARMRRSIKTAEATPAVPVAVPVPVAPVVHETPVETCVREFRELPSAAWKTKWLNNQNNRPVADQAVAEGRI